MNLTLQWTNPVQHPSCGYKAVFRRKSDSAYTELAISGTTSGTSLLTIGVPAPASYEGYIQSDCCLDNLSTGDPFGVNGYSPLSIAIAVQANPLHYIATITSTYANPYDNVITGSFTSSVQGTVSFTVTYPADSTTADVTLVSTPASAAEVISNITVSSITPSFSNGGSLQQLDPVRTPAYFEFYSTSGTTVWNGDPLVLPSFTLDAFNVTETDTNGNVITGDLLVSWAQPYLYGGGTGIYSSFTVVIQETVSLDDMGTWEYIPSANGLRNATIKLSRIGANFITSSLSYTMHFNWADGNEVETKDCYLPLC